MKDADFTKISHDLIDQHYPAQRMRVADALKRVYLAALEEAAAEVERSSTDLIDRLTSDARTKKSG